MEDLERLKTACAVHFARLIVDADDVVDFDELAWFEDAFPRSMLEQHGFLDAEGHFTEALEVARIEALLKLPGALGESAKLELLGTLHQAALADGRLAVDEYRVLRSAAERLDLDPDALSQHLDALVGVEAPARRPPGSRS